MRVFLKLIRYFVSMKSKAELCDFKDYICEVQTGAFVKSNPAGVGKVTERVI